MAPDLAGAAEWPTKPVTMIVPFAAGGNTDTMARILAQRLSEKLGQQFVVDNRAGASGIIGANDVARATPDGYTVLFAASPQISIVPNLQKVPYNPVADFAPIGIFGAGPFILAITSDVPAKTLSEFIAYAKTKPGQISYATGGVGTVSHLAAALFANKAGIDLIHVPYRGGGPAMADFLGKHVQMYFGNASELLPHVGEESFRVIGVSTEKRMPQLPDIPTLSELFPGFVLTSWNGLLGPAKLPPGIIDLLSRETTNAAHDPAIVELLTRLGIEAAGTTPAKFAEVIRDDHAIFTDAIEAAGLTPK